MRRDYKKSLFGTIFKCMPIGAAFLVAGCGLIGDSLNNVRTWQSAPGVLYQPEFYAKATPDEVKSAIGGRSLATERYVKKSVFKGRTNGLGALVKPLQVLWPDSEVVEHSPLFPLQVAVSNTPYPEVISILLDAGASTGPLLYPVYVENDKLNDGIIDILLTHGSAYQRCDALRIYVIKGNVARVNYCLDLPGEKATSMSACKADKLMQLAQKAKQQSVIESLQERGFLVSEDVAQETFSSQAL